MLRRRLLWFMVGFGSATAAMTHFVFKDLWNDRHTLSSQLKQKFDALDTRVSNLEPILPHNLSSPGLGQFERSPGSFASSGWV